MSKCNCHEVCKIKAAIKLAHITASVRQIENDFNTFWAMAKSQSQALLIAVATDYFMRPIEQELIDAQVNFELAFSDPFRAIELY